MHISEGVLSGPILASGAAVAVAGCAIGLKKINHEQIVHVAMMAAAFFVASLIHVNVGPAGVHLVLNGIVGLLLGFAAFPAILTALVLQSVFFQYGGLTALGANVVVMAVPAVIVHYLCLPMLGRSSKLDFIAGVVAGAGAVLLSSLLLCAALWFTEKNFWEICVAVFSANMVIVLIEGIIGGFCVAFLMKVYPEIIPGKKV